MAEGTFLKSSTFSGSVGGNFKINLYYTYSQSAEGNYTNVKYNLYFQSINYYYGSGSASNGYINDEWVGNTTSIGMNEEKYIGSKTVTVYHNNDGTFPATNYKASMNCPWNGVGSAYLEGTLTGLPTIPRYFTQTPNIVVASKTETSYTINWSTSETCNWVRYHFDGSAGWHDVFSGSGTSGSFTISNGDSIYGDSTGTVNIGVNTSHSIYVECRRQDSGLWSNSNTITDSTYDYPKPTSVSSDKIGNAFNVFVSNPVGRIYTLDLISNNNGDVVGSYTGTINGAVVGFDDPTTVNKMYASIPNSPSGTYYARVTYGSSVKTYGNGTYSVKGTETPTVTTTALDTNKTLNGNDNTLTIQSLTNDSTNKTIIKYISDVAVNVSAISNYNATINPNGYSTKYGGNNTISGASHTYENVESTTFRGYATDNRGLQGNSLATGLTLIDYIKLTLEDIDLYREDQTSSELKCSGSGNYFTNKFGTNGENNSLVFKLRYKEINSSTWSNWVTKTMTIGTNSYSFDFTVGNDFDYTKSYNFEFEIADKCMTIIDTETSKPGIPVQGLFENYHEAFGVKTFEKDNNNNITINGSIKVEGEDVDTTINDKINKTSLIPNNAKSNTRLGDNALTNFELDPDHIDFGKNNTAIGNEALSDTTIGYDNTSIGSFALYKNTTAHSNTAIGKYALRTNTTGVQNTAIGKSALYSNTIGHENTAVGIWSLYGNTEGYNNTAIGRSTLYNNSLGNGNTALGASALHDTTTGSYNTAVGNGSLYKNTTATHNTGVGNNALYENTTGHDNTTVGSNSLKDNTTGSYNTAIGVSSLAYLTTGSRNTALGNGAGHGNYSDTTCLGCNSIATGDNQVQLGASGTSVYAYSTLNVRSDKRDKKDIEDIDLGLEFINKLRPVKYKWKYRNDGYEGNRYHEGLIAQEVKEVMNELNVDFGGYQDHSINGGEDVLTLGYGEFIAPLIKAIQEQQKMIEDLNKKVEKLSKKAY